MRHVEYDELEEQVQGFGGLRITSNNMAAINFLQPSGPYLECVCTNIGRVWAKK
jgi:hypothetical protein